MTLLSAQALAVLHTKCFDTPRPWSQAEFAGFLSDPKSFVICAGEQGFILGRVIADEAELLTLAVDPAARRAGHGSALLSGYEAQARARGGARSFLEVAADNDAAKALYLGADYRESGRRRNYYRTPSGGFIDALIYTKPL